MTVSSIECSTSIEDVIINTTQKYLKGDICIINSPKVEYISNWIIDNIYKVMETE
jgi:hypothetical protein